MLGISGGIAAYKTPDLVRRLKEAGAKVQVILTAEAERFVTPLSLQAVTGEPPQREMFAADGENLKGDAMPHISLARWADLLLIAPATADLMARLAQGRAQDLLGATCLACDAPRLLAPAMNTRMWENPATAANASRLQQQGWQLAGPASGDQACGDNGSGRMLEPTELVERASELFAVGSLAGKRVLVNAGPTHEAIDPVRYLGNHSSGRMGFALAQAAAEAGAQVQLVAGPVQLPTPPGVERTDVTTAEQMREATLRMAAGADLLIACAAVADYRPVEAQEQKIRRLDCGSEMVLALQANPDIVAEVAGLTDRPYILAFAAETGDLERNARKKLERKGVDMIAANDISRPEIGFNSTLNAVTLVRADSKAVESFADMPKESLARALIDRLAKEVTCS